MPRLTNRERRKYKEIVFDLYYQGKNYPQIQKELLENYWIQVTVPTLSRWCSEL